MSSASTSRARARLRLVSDAAGASAPDPPSRLPGLSDGQLVALVRDHDRQAFETLYRRHAPFAINLAIRVQGSLTDVEDIVHDAFLKVHHRVSDLRDGAAFKSWLGAIVIRLVRTRLRRRRLLSTLGLGSDQAVELDAIASAEAGPDARAQLAQVYALLQTLPTDERIAWTLRHVERHRLETVAQLSGCSLATAKRRIFRAQRYLSQHFVASSPAEYHEQEQII